MTLLRVSAPVLVELDSSGQPFSLTWEGRRWQVSDMPTPLALLGPTHPLPVVGWRFQGTDVAGGETRVFDVRRDEESGAWLVTAVWD